MQVNEAEWTEVSWQECRDIQTRVLRSFAAACDEQGFDFCLFGGSLLGAVRHEGFIPWDDDIDVAMRRQEYERFILHARQFSNSTALSVHSLSTNEAWNLPFARVSDDRTRLFEESDTACPVGIGIDLFPIDDWWPGRWAIMQRWIARMLRYVLAAKSVRTSDRRVAWKNNVLAVMKRACRPVSARTLSQMIEAVCARRPVAPATHLGVIVWGCQESVPVEAYQEFGTVVFEGDMYQSPGDADRVLREIYGDYMTLPPIEQQVTHHDFRAFKRINR